MTTFLLFQTAQLTKDPDITLWNTIWYSKSQKIMSPTIIMDFIIPKKFEERYKDLADDSEKFFSCLESRLPKAFRVNTIKADKKKVLDNFSQYGIEIKPVSWYPQAFIADNFSIGNSIEHFMGHIYIQELTSMLPAVVASAEISAKSLVLDACAAPGSKTTQIAAFMENKGCIIANDIDYMRTKALKFNMEKMGVLNTIITNCDFRFFSFKNKFDIILLDSPCTSEGTIRKNKSVLSSWSEKKIFGMSRLQKQFILKAFDLVKEDGLIIYSTCTFAPEENEEVIQHLLENRKDAKIERIKLDGFKLSSGIDEWNGNSFSEEVKKSSRVWPHHNDTDGFFLAKIRKTL